MENFESFDQNHGLTPFKKIIILRLHKLHVFIVQKRVSLKNIERRIFRAYFASNKKMEKCQIFRRNPWTIPFEKIPVFGLFLTSCFYCLNRRFSLLVYREKYYSGLYCLE